MRWAYRRFKNRQGGKFDETCGVRIGLCICKESKNWKINNKKRGDKQKKQDSYSTMQNKTHFSLLVFDCDFEDALLILIALNKHKHDLLSFKIFVSKFEGLKGRHFMVGPGRHLALLRHCLGLRVHSFTHFCARFSFGENRGGSSPRKKRNTSRSTAISDSSVGSTPRWDQARSDV